MTKRAEAKEKKPSLFRPGRTSKSVALVAAGAVIISILALYAGPAQKTTQPAGGEDQEVVENQGAGAEDQQPGENYQPPVDYARFRSYASLGLESTPDNLPVTGFEFYAPLLQGGENLGIYSYSTETENRGDLRYLDGWVIENTLQFSGPKHSTENTPEAGLRSVVRVGSLYPGENLALAWRCWAPENSTLYDTSDNETYVGFTYQPTWSVSVSMAFTLVRENVALENAEEPSDVTQWAWGGSREIEANWSLGETGWILLETSGV